MPVGTIRALSLRAIVSAICSMDGINMPSPKTVSISGYEYIPLARRKMSPFAVSRSRLLPTAFTPPYDVKSEGKKILPLPLFLIAVKILSSILAITLHLSQNYKLFATSLEFVQNMRLYLAVLAGMPLSNELNRNIHLLILRKQCVNKRFQSEYLVSFIDDDDYYCKSLITNKNLEAV